MKEKELAQDVKKKDMYDNMIQNIVYLLEEVQIVSGKMHSLRNKITDGDIPIYVGNKWSLPDTYNDLGVLTQVALCVGRIRAEVIMQNAILNKLQAE
jgi:hypothetical protein